MKRIATLSLISTALLAASCVFNAGPSVPQDYSSAVACAADTCLTVEIDGAVGMLRGDLYIPRNAASDGKVPAVIICHGLTASRNETLFNGFALSAQQAGMVAVKFDFNGHGDSDGEFRNMTVINEKEDLENIFAFVRNLGFVDPARVAVLGHSQGGAVAGLFASEHPELGALVLCASGSLSLQRALQTGHFIYSDFDPQNIPDSIPSFGENYLSREFFTTLKTVDMTGALASYKGPACIVNGVWDKLVPVSDSRTYHELMPQSEIHILDSLGHSYHQNPGKVIDLCTDFLGRTLF